MAMAMAAATARPIFIPRATIVAPVRPRLAVHCSAAKDDAGGGGDDDWEKLLEDDIRDLKSSRRRPRTATTKPAQNAEKGQVRDIVDKVLVADFFFVLLVLAWFVLGLAERTVLSTSRLLDSWFPLWSPLFQPALGLLMAGAVLSALSSKKA